MFCLLNLSEQHGSIYRAPHNWDCVTKTFLSEEKKIEIPCPLVQIEQHQYCHMARKKTNMEITIKEKPFWQKSPINCPLEKELPSQVERHGDVANRVLQQERKPKNQLEKTTSN